MFRLTPVFKWKVHVCVCDEFDWIEINLLSQKNIKRLMQKKDQLFVLLRCLIVHC